VAGWRQDGYSTTTIPEEEKFMVKRTIVGALTCTLGCLMIALAIQAQQGPAAAPVKKIYNTAKQKLMAGKQIFGGSIESSDPNIYCTMANAGFDFTWIEMQHSTLTYEEVAKMIWACRGAAATPFIRVPDATESDIQKATDIGALGIIVPTVDTVEKAEAAVRWSKYPPVGRRSVGGGQHKALYGDDYRQTANDNMMVVIMIETPIGVANAEKIAAVPGIDVIFAASGDMANFSGHKQGEPEYEALITRVHDVALKAGLKLGGPQNWKNRPGYTFFQAPPEWMLIQTGAQANLGIAPAAAASAPAK
jgi:2-keto-3-deoxy-L-rhamnonate aldolase RhmA